MRNIRTLSLYIMRMSLLPFLVGVGGFIVFVSVQTLYFLSEEIIQYQVSIWRLFELLYYKLPFFAAMGIPVGVLLSILWLISQLGMNNELMALQVHGISFKKIVIPFLLLGLIFSVCTFLLSDYLVPDFNHKANQTLIQHVYRRPELTIQTNQFLHVGESRYFYVRRFDTTTNVFEEVLIYDLGSRDMKVFQANKAVQDGVTGTWKLVDGRLFTLDNQGHMKLDSSFEEMEIELTQDIDEFIRSTSKSAQDMTSQELIERISSFGRMGLRTESFEVELLGRYANSLGPLIIALIGVPMSLLFNIRSKSWSVIITFMLIVLYQGSGAWLSAMGKEGLLPPAWATWSPNLFFSSVGLILFVLLDTKIMYRIKEFFSRLLTISTIVFLISLSAFFFSSGRVMACEWCDSVPAMRAVAQEQSFDAKVESDIMRMDGKEGVIILEGDVQITFEEFQLRAPIVWLYLNDVGLVDYLIAEGSPEKKVQLIREKDTYTANTIKMYVQDNSTFLYSLRGKTTAKNKKGQDKDVYVFGEQSRGKTIMDEEIMEIHRGYITTCDDEKPHYRFQADYIVIKSGMDMIAYDLVLYIFEIPVLPYPIFFMALDRTVQPIENTFSYGGESGWKAYLRFNYLATEDEVGSIFIETVEKGRDSGTRIGIDNKFLLPGDTTATLSMNQRASDSFADQDGSIRFQMLTKIADPFQFLFYYNTRNALENWELKNRNTETGIKVTGPFFNQQFTLEAFRKEIRSPTIGRNEYLLPSFTLSRATFPIGPEFYPFKLHLTQFSLIAQTTTPATATMDEVIRDLDFVQRTGLRFELPEIAPGGFLILGTTNSVIDMVFEHKDDEFANDFKIDNTLPFRKFDFSLGDRNVVFQTGYTMRAGYLKSLNDDVGWRYSEAVDTSLSFNLGLWKTDFKHAFLFVKGENLARFSHNRETNLLSMNSSLNLPFIGTQLGIRTSYDFIKKEDQLSNPVITTTSSWKVMNYDLSARTTSIWDIKEERIDSTTYGFGLRTTDFGYSVDFVARYHQDDPIDKIINKWNFRLGSFGKMESLSSDSEFHYVPKDNKIPFIRNRLTASFDDFSLGLNTTFREPRLDLSFSGDFPGLQLRVGTSFDTEAFEFLNLSIGFTRDLHCWTNETSITFKQVDGSLELDKIETSFYITAFPEKFVKFNPKDMEVDFAIF